MSAPVSIVHVVPRLSMTGPVRSLAAGAKYARRLGLVQAQRVVALERELAPAAVLLLRREGVELTIHPDRDALHDVLERADLVFVHFWNCPSMYEFLLRPLPAARVVVWVRMQGLDPPQVVPDALVDFADELLLTTPVTLASPALRDHTGPDAPMIAPGIADMDRLHDWRAAPHDGFVVGYVGTVNRGKLHPRFLELCAAVDVPDARFVVYGTGGDEAELRRAAADLGLGDRLDLRGHVEDLATALADVDVFGYPLRADTYASSEKALQEAMWVGIPPVVFPYGGLRELVQPDVTGLVAHEEAEYSRHLEHLAADPARRARLGAAARHYAREAFDPQAATTRLDAFIRRAVDGPKRQRAWPEWGPTPAEWFARSLGEHGEPYLRALGAREPGEAARAVAGSSFLVLRGEGGLVQWRNYHRDDATLDAWCSAASGAPAAGA